MLSRTASLPRSRMAAKSAPTGVPTPSSWWQAEQGLRRRRPQLWTEPGPSLQYQRRNFGLIETGQRFQRGRLHRLRLPQLEQRAEERLHVRQWRQAERADGGNPLRHLLFFIAG